LVLSADFSVGGDSTVVAHSVAYGATVNLALLSLTGVREVAWTIGDPDSEGSTAGTSHSSLVAPTITPAGAPTGATASFTMVADPGDGEGRSVTVKCKVTGQNGATAAAYRIVGVRNAKGIIPYAVDEALYRNATVGWTETANTALAGDQVANVRNFGATGDGTTDDTDALTDAFAAGDDIFLPAGTYLVTGLELAASNKRIRGAGMGRTIIKLANASNAHVLQAEDMSDIQLEDLTLDGNKANQDDGTGNDWRCLYALGDCHRWRLKNVEIKNAVDHGLFASSGGDSEVEAFKDSVVDSCYAHDCGSSAHISGGGSGGTGFVGGCTSTRWAGCYAPANYLNGFKGNGQYDSCYAYDSVGGGGFETGFGAPTREGATFRNCFAYDNAGGGFRHQGQGDQILMDGCVIYGNGSSGITLLNTVTRAQIVNCRISNNGSNASRTATTGIDGISILSSGGSGPTQVIIDGCQIFDDQVDEMDAPDPTQDYGIYVEDDTVDLLITPNNIIQDNLTGPLFLDTDTKADNVRIGAYTGAGTRVRNLSEATVTGTTGATDLMTVVIPAAEQFEGQVLRLTATGRVTGTVGTKTIRLSVNGTTNIISSQTAGETQDWACRIEVIRDGNTSVQVIIQKLEEGGTSNADYLTVGVSLGTDLTIKFTGQLGDGADSIIQSVMTLTTDM
jgi:hypothetical protein